MDIIIDHNPDCGASHNTLAMLRNARLEPHVIASLKTPPSRGLLEQRLARMGISIRDVQRANDPPPQRSEPVREDGARDVDEPAYRVTMA